MGSDFIPLKTLLSEVRAAEYMWYQTVACHLDERNRTEAQLSRKRLALIDELMTMQTAAACFPADFEAEKIFLNTMSKIVRENGFVADNQYSHVFLELDDGSRIKIKT